MRPYAAPLMLVAAVAAAGCTRTVVERPVAIVDRPAVVEKQTVIERPVIAAAPAASCTYAGTSYSHGSSSCQASSQYRCTDGVWASTPQRC